jgi:HAD superfamily hydrolase (TIGR01509 family)
VTVRSAVPRAVVFDLDGTLLDSLPLVLAAIGHALEPFGFVPTMDIFARLGGPPAKFLPDLLPDPRHTPEAMARMEDFHRKNTRMIRPFAGAAELLEALREREVQAAVWTGRDRASTERLLAEHALDRHLGAVVCGDDFPTHKPDPEGLREILRRLEIAPGEALFVGDADVDVLGGADCGVETILIRHTRAVAPEISARAWRAVSAPADAYALVQRRIGSGA